MTEVNLNPTISTRMMNTVDALKDLPRTHPGLFWILVFTLISRIAVYLIGQPWNQEVVESTILDGDAAVYDRVARGFLTGLWITDMPWAHDRTFGYPFFLTAIYAISNNAIWLVLALQTLMNIFMVPMVYLTSKTLFGSQQSGTFAAALFALSAIPLAWATRFLFTETLFIFLFLIFIMVYLRTWKSESFRWFLVLGVLLGIATIVRSVLQFFIVIPVIIILLQQLQFSKKLILVMGIVCGLVVVISPFQISNHNQYGHFTLSTAGTAVFVESVVTAKAMVDKTKRKEVLLKLVGEDWEAMPNPFEKSATAKHKSIKWALNHPDKLITLYGLGMVSFLIGTEKSAYLYVIARQERPRVSLDNTEVETFIARVSRNLQDISKEYFLTPVLIIKLLLNYAFVIGGLVILIRRDQKLLAIFFVLSIAYFVLVTAHAGRAPRYKIPVLPIYAILGGGAWSLVVAYWHSSRSVRKRLSL